ncbi:MULTISPECIES: helix-turn-helix transcriptional regulator [unclassified Clostridium]|uniref:helix-turn-helix transcriptional regulator n=1 Tax=unclassified Clostridium TaxID=2614128 RepID=UPI0002980B90|nr:MULTISPECIES: helix-turn-helix transcriptional regulator [unclassified Clostridium]EKQ55499.1 MAG: putative transcriptional regulator [Clostridium sp. Maddingley MBC34-26]
MLKTNLKVLRKRFKLSQEQVAEEINVSRQTVAKWENGESTPDINSCAALAELYDVTLDNLVNYSDEKNSTGIPPRGKHIFGIVKVDENGCVVIPEKARQIFSIKAGDSLLMLGDELEGGLALMCENEFMKFLSECSKLSD